VNARRSTLHAALAFAQLPPHAPELQLLHRYLDSWHGVGDVVVLETLADRRLAVIVDLLRELLYAFAARPTDLETVASAVLKEQQLL
jgi:hypothetical protein